MNKLFIYTGTTEDLANKYGYKITRFGVAIKILDNISGLGIHIDLWEKNKITQWHGCDINSIREEPVDEKNILDLSKDNLVKKVRIRKKLKLVRA